MDGDVMHSFATNDEDMDVEIVLGGPITGKFD